MQPFFSAQQLHPWSLFWKWCHFIGWSHFIPGWCSFGPTLCSVCLFGFKLHISLCVALGTMLPLIALHHASIAELNMHPYSWFYWSVFQLVGCFHASYMNINTSHNKKLFKLILNLHNTAFFRLFLWCVIEITRYYYFAYCWYNGWLPKQFWDFEPWDFLHFHRYFYDGQDFKIY